ncbi:MAG: hypothetical protein PHN55_09055 [Dysgonamonadaceae bacterium]|nr:hypothetical protein [Dysgonamonadaceae bacterium]
MGKIISLIKNIILEIKDRWNSKTPKFFKAIVKIGISISGIGLAMHTAMIASGAIEPQWWIDIYPYIIAIPAGMAACAKLTRDHGNNNQTK